MGHVLRGIRALSSGFRQVRDSYKRHEECAVVRIGLKRWLRRESPNASVAWALTHMTARPAHCSHFCPIHIRLDGYRKGISCYTHSRMTSGSWLVSTLKAQYCAHRSTDVVMLAIPRS